jgi:hypothetical protein
MRPEISSGLWHAYKSGSRRSYKFALQLAAVVIDEPLLLLTERSIENYSRKKVLACTGEVMNFIFNSHGLPFSGATLQVRIGDGEG